MTKYYDDMCIYLVSNANHNFSVTIFYVVIELIFKFNLGYIAINEDIFKLFVVSEFQYILKCWVNQ